MSEEDRKIYLSDIAYFWKYKGDIERYDDFSMKKLRLASPVLADAYERYLSATDTFIAVLDKVTDYEL